MSNFNLRTSDKVQFQYEPDGRIRVGYVQYAPYGIGVHLIENGELIIFNLNSCIVLEKL